MAEPQTFFVFDVESVGLHGEAFAFGYVVVTRDGQELDCGKFSCWLDSAKGDPEDRAWVMKNCPDAVNLDQWVQTRPTWRSTPPVCQGPTELKAAFWGIWSMQPKGTIMVADCAWPVEARFLASCIDVDSVARKWGGPYPLIDVGSVRLAANLDPLENVGRLPNELPKHDPLADARQSARLFLEALHEGVSWAKAYAKGRADECAEWQKR